MRSQDTRWILRRMPPIFKPASGTKIYYIKTDKIITHCHEHNTNRPTTVGKKKSKFYTKGIFVARKNDFF